MTSGTAQPCTGAALRQRLHCREMQPDEATGFMATDASLTRNTAAAEVDRYCAWPTQAPSYLTGRQEIERLRAEWTAASCGSSTTRSRRPAACRSGWLAAPL